MKKLICSAIVLLLMLSVTACSNLNDGAESDEPDGEVEELLPVEPDEPEINIVTEQPALVQEPLIDENGFVWRVAPELEYEMIYSCGCGFYSYELWEAPGIDTKTGLVSDEMHGGHGGGGANYLYDEGKNLYGFYGQDESGEHFLMWPEDEFLQKYTWRADRLWTFQKIDSSLVKANIKEAEWGSYTVHDLSGAFITEKHAVAQGTAFISDFIFDHFDRYSDYPFFGGGPLYYYGATTDFIAVRLDGEWGIIDKEGNTAVPFRFEEILFIDEETAFAKINGKYGILDVNRTVESIEEVT